MSSKWEVSWGGQAKERSQDRREAKAKHGQNMPMLEMEDLAESKKI